MTMSLFGYEDVIVYLHFFSVRVVPLSSLGDVLLDW